MSQAVQALTSVVRHQLDVQASSFLGLEAQMVEAHSSEIVLFNVNGRAVKFNQCDVLSLVLKDRASDNL